MIDHISLATADLGKARRFYTAAFAPLGAVEVAVTDVSAGWAIDGSDDFYVNLVAPETISNNPKTHYAFSAPSRAAVDAFHAAALENGGTDDGPPGLRPQYHQNYYAAFVIDPDGRRIEAVCHRAPD
ncbi:VOC family protein [Peteryoungia ipomoeae]|uniref:VOC family protein n=1 Tax=Peteryoungia ipomoeae TaxID=1210932 RepID=A0A4S8P9Q9_9HYPH|nr:VOC family protein [Peteryoungia ipomoeae]THV25862.1 VOC family protein [Peteryoungia ipomoeae]